MLSYILFQGVRAVRGGSDYSVPPNADEAPFDPDCIVPHDFRASNVCINTEVGTAANGRVSVFEFIETRLVAGAA